MKTNKVLTLALAPRVAAVVPGCGEKPSEQPANQANPQVNDENCKPASVAKIEDKGAQQAFSSLCLRRGGGFKPSEKKEW
jgi:entry exclusion lipoprotein TrbK